ncbi:hypothetical protein ACJJID_00165 (plasmid) [Microbulbifer sp. CnH-101-G]|uniref:DUF1281 family ferredoxin-like fold protein n=1 Tax=Microbulbifer sp. CnH-101-G TaxID=3243393 RepID=UPI0040399953
MPNHITNQVKVIGPGAAEFLAGLFNKHGYLSFEKIIPIPQKLLEEHGWYECNRHFWSTKWNAYNQGVPGVKWPQTRETGRPRWTRGDGSVLRHKTAYAKRVWKKRLKRFRPTEIHFDTAWCTPGKVWIALAKKLPQGLRIEVKFADEDIGSNCGQFSIVPGDFVGAEIAPSYQDQSPEERKRWRIFAFHISWGKDAKPTDHGMNEDYEYVDEEEEWDAA